MAALWTSAERGTAHLRGLGATVVDAPPGGSPRGLADAYLKVKAVGRLSERVPPSVGRVVEFIWQVVGGSGEGRADGELPLLPLAGGRLAVRRPTDPTSLI